MHEALIKAQLKMLGLDEGLWEQVKPNSEADVPRAVTQFAIDRGVNSEADRRSKKAVETAEQRLRAEFEKEKAELLKTKGQPDNHKPADNGNGTGTGDSVDIAKIVAAGVAEAMKPINDRLAAIETARAVETRSAKIGEALKAAGLPASAAKYIRVDQDDQIEQAVKDFQADFGALKQAEKDSQIANGTGGLPRSEGAQAANEAKGKLAAELRNAAATSGSPDGLFKAAEPPGLAKP